MRASRLKIISFFFLICAFHSLKAQKVGVVLSGGGAKGLAHVGVLKYLEENDIPIDYIVGTSMGGIVAGCYAAGFSVDEIERIMLSADFQRWVEGELEKGFNYYYSKDDDNAAFLSLHLSLDSTLNIQLATSLASDLSLNFALLEQFVQPSANANYNFDSLFIPARIMAADVFTQNEVAIDSGSLGSAVRTTLSVPFFYKPIKFNGEYLFDGGIYNNFPVDVAQREFNPDVIIGVNVSSKVFTDYPDREDDDLLNRSLLFMLLDKSNPEKVPKSGIYLEPNLEGFNAFDFDKVQSLIDSGYAIASSKGEEIKSKISRRISCDEITAKRNKFHSKNTPLSFSDIKLHGFHSKQRKFIKHIFKFKEGEKLYFGDIKKGYFRLVSENYFQTIYPDISYDDNSESYHLHIYGRPENNLNVEVGGAVATRNVSAIFFGIEHYFFDNYLLKNSANFYTGSFYKSAQLKTRLNLPALGQFYIESDLTYNNWDYVEDEDILRPEVEPTLLTRTDRRYNLNLGFPLGSKFKLVASGGWIDNEDDFSNLKTFSSGDTLDQIEIDGIKTGLELSRNNLNRRLYPNNGSEFRLKVDYFNVTEFYKPGSTSLLSSNLRADHSWFRAQAKVQQYFRKGKYSTGYYFEGNFSNQPFFSNYFATLVYSPGFDAIVDSRTLFLENFRAHNYITLGLRNVISLRKNLDFRLEGYIFKAFNPIAQTQNQEPFYASDNIEDFYLAGTAALVLSSPIGPISLSANYYDDAETQFGVLMHVGYLMFQRRSTE